MRYAAILLLHGSDTLEGSKTPMHCRRPYRLLVSLILAAFIVGATSQSRAQTRQIPPRGTQPAPKAQARKPIDPKLVRVLQEWHRASMAIEKLEGRHKRFTYDYVFNVQKQAVGEFYYRAPDAGRIDLSPAKLKSEKGKPLKDKKRHPVTGKEVIFTVQSDLPERWICDGKRIVVIDDVEKTAQQFNIPAEAQGANIMDGPLPFLFGMPPQKAVARYDMKLLVANEKLYEIFVQPKLPHDKANYKWARVQIERASMLPIAVQMMDPTDRRETVYTFPEIKKNPRKPLIPWVTKDPFNPKLKDYVIQAPLPALKTAGPTGKVPSIVGFNFKEAQAKLKQAGYVVKLLKGAPAINKELVHHVASQSPKGRTALKPGSLVNVTLFTPQVQQTGAKVPAVPNVAGLFYKDAEAKLKAAGFGAKYHRGRVGLKPQDYLTVYEQTPPSGAILERGRQVHMTLYVKPTVAAKP
jgi:TIGR03009 family protein